MVEELIDIDMVKKIKIGILFGGRSTEHEVSLQSAKSIIEAIDKNKYELVLIGIDKNGYWHLHDNSNYLLNDQDPELIRLDEVNEKIILSPGQDSSSIITKSQITQSQVGELQAPVLAVDVVFPVLHGSYGEDGTIQGLLEILNLPYVGPGVLGSAIAMDKDVSKRLLAAAGLNVAKFLVVRTGEQLEFEYCKEKLGVPLFIKPANAGSSVGVSKVYTQEEFDLALIRAFKFDNKVLVEEFIEGREIEISVLGNVDIMVSAPGEIVPASDFYSYQSKYLDEHGAELKIPASVSAGELKNIEQAAKTAYRALELEGMARIDMFLTPSDELYINEANTIPGFTRVSMYPKLWEASGISYSKLIDILIELALERHKLKSELLRSIPK